jgi:quercetin dioxygenase-like cupin family protein
MYGTVMIGKLRDADPSAVVERLGQWERERPAPGFVDSNVLSTGDGRVVVAVRFASRDEYERLSASTSQDEWWNRVVRPLLAEEPVWIDGDWVHASGSPTPASTLVKHDLATPDETRPFEAGSGPLELVATAKGPVGRATFQPGWRWSQHVKPIAKTDSCQADHAGYVVAGRMAIVMDDGARDEFGPGDVMICPPGHDAWVVGDEPCVVIDWAGLGAYASR